MNWRVIGKNIREILQTNRQKLITREKKREKSKRRQQIGFRRRLRKPNSIHSLSKNKAQKESCKNNEREERIWKNTWKPTQKMYSRFTNLKQAINLLQRGSKGSELLIKKSSRRGNSRFKVLHTEITLKRAWKMQLYQ